MRDSTRHAAALAVASLLALAAVARQRPVPAPAPDPNAVELIHELALAESPAALRDLPGWRAPKRIVMATQNPNGTGVDELRRAMESAAPGVEIVMVPGTNELVTA